MVSEGLEKFLLIFDITHKSRLVEHCKTLTIFGRDLANLILACQFGRIPIEHFPVFHEHTPEHLEVNDQDRESLVRNGVGPLSFRGQKAVRKVTTIFKERRLFAGHMFWVPSHTGEWHFLYFDQRDRAQVDNHWKHGSHIHLINWLTHPRLDPNDLLNKLLQSERPKLSGSLHVRFVR